MKESRKERLSMMNYRQITSVIITNLNQMERNMNGLHERGKQDEIDELAHKLRTIKYQVAALTENSYTAIKKALKEGNPQ
jgi:hypothetical protein